MTAREPARSCRSSMFWVTRVSRPPFAASALSSRASATCAGFGRGADRGCAGARRRRRARLSDRARRPAGSRASSGRTVDPDPLARLVAKGPSPLSADTPAPVRTKMCLDIRPSASARPAMAARSTSSRSWPASARNVPPREPDLHHRGDQFATIRTMTAASRRVARSASMMSVSAWAVSTITSSLRLSTPARSLSSYSSTRRA